MVSIATFIGAVLLSCSNRWPRHTGGVASPHGALYAILLQLVKSFPSAQGQVALRKDPIRPGLW
jgi:hypothetical protein